jgi:hypothetical protein
MREMTKRKGPARPAGKPGQAGGEYKPQGRLLFGGGHGPEVKTKPGQNPLGRPPHGGRKPKPHRPQYGGPGAKPPGRPGPGGLGGLQGVQMTGPGEFIGSGNGISIDTNVGAGGTEISTNFL